MYLDTHILKQCSGCMACADICPTEAIGIKEGDDSFFYPYIDNKKCIRCNLCKRVCPDDKLSDLYPKTCFAGRAINEYDYQRSASGGAFKCIVSAWLKTVDSQKAYVSGCIMDKDFKVRHIVKKCVTADDADCFSGSKYIQSDMQTCYSEIINLLKDGNYVLMSGTPCQVAAMKQCAEIYKLENLFLVDLLCHGVISQREFDDYKNNEEIKNNSKMLSYQFKTKEILDNGTHYIRSAKITYENGKVFRLSRLEDPLLLIYYGGTKHREACTDCSFNKCERFGDISIGDAWGIKELFCDMEPLHGVSAVIINNQKGAALTDNILCQMDLRNCSFEFIAEKNGGITG